MALSKLLGPLDSDPGLYSAAVATAAYKLIVSSIPCAVMSVVETLPVAPEVVWHEFCCWFRVAVLLGLAHPKWPSSKKVLGPSKSIYSNCRPITDSIL